MDRIKAMRQRDWSRLFGFLCAGVAAALSVAAYPGAQWDALILTLGALMLLRAATDGPSASRAEGMVRALRLILFMFAFAAVNRAQGGVEGAVQAALGNWLLWAVAALLLALPVLRKGVPWGRVDPREAAFTFGVGFGFWLLFGWMQGAGDMADLRTLIATAAVVTAAPILQAKGQPLVVGAAFALVLVCVVAAPGAPLWPVALAALPAAAVFAWLRRV